MSKSWYHTLCQIGIAVPLSLASVAISTGQNHSLAQLIPDNSLGGENSLVTPEALRDLIEGGARRGDNLFHSFTEFNVNKGQNVFFANPDEVLNILTRVTGGNPSNILGTLGVDGAANLFLLNPNGIFFGENAQLSLTGSFLATTADSFVFEDGFEFSASNPQAPPLLTVNIPIGLRFRDNPGNIAINQSNLAVNQGQSLSLIGGSIDITGSGSVQSEALRGALRAPGGRIELGGLTATGEVAMNPDFTFIFPEDVTRGDISLSNGALVSVASVGGGDIGVNAQNLTITDASSLRAGIEAGADTNDAQAGNIIVNVIDNISIDGNQQITRNDGETQTLFSGIFNDINENASGRAGDITIDTTTLNLSSGAHIQSTMVNGALLNTNNRGGDVTINATESIFLSNGSPLNFDNKSIIQSKVEDGSGGNTGDVTINTGVLSLSGSEINSIVARNAEGNSGDVTINATESISLRNAGENEEEQQRGDLRSFILTLVWNRSTGDAGNITIETGSLDVFVSNIQAQIGRGSTGNGGDINIIADSINLQGGSIETALRNGAQGEAGNINITANSLSLVQVPNVQNSRIQALTENAVIGDGGDITINANSVSITDSRIEASIGGDQSQGNAGNIEINTGEDGSIEVFSEGLGSSINTSIGQNSTGNTGNITLNTSSLSVRENFTDNGAQATISSILASGAIATGTNGNIEIDADTVLIRGDALIESSIGSSAKGDGGAINITTNALSLDGAEASIESSIGSNAEGDGGSLVINSQTIELLNAAFFRLSASRGADGNAGNVTIYTDTLKLTDGSYISTDSDATGSAGTINITANESVILDGVFPNNIFNEYDPEGFFVLRPPTRLESDSRDTGGGGGEIIVNTPSLQVINGALITTSTSGNADGGSITINTDTTQLGNGGQILAITRGEGNAGNVNLNVSNNLTIEGIDSSWETVLEQLVQGTQERIDSGEYPNNIDPESVAREGLFTISGNSTVFAGTTSESTGDGGSIVINSESVTVNNQGIISVSTQGSGDSGIIDLNSASLIMSDRGTVSAVSEGSGLGGNILVEANNINLSNQATIEAFSQVAGNAGLINIQASNVTLTNSSEITSSSSGTGLAGNIQIEAFEQVNIANDSEISSEGFLGSISIGETITPQSITISQSQLTTNDFSTGLAGNINLNAVEKITISDNSNISSDALGNNGQAGNINISSGVEVDITDSSIFSNNLSVNEGLGGSINISANEQVSVTSSNIFSASISNRGVGGSISINSGNGSVFIANSSGLNSSNFGSGSAGDININAEQQIEINQSSISSDAFDSNNSSGAGFSGVVNLLAGESIEVSSSQITTENFVGSSEVGGNINFTAPSLTFTDNTTVNSSTSGSGNAGTIEINVVDTLLVTGNSEILATTEENSTGNGGNINIDPELVIISDGSEIAVDSQGTGAGGNITLVADNLTLDNGEITARTNNSDGGNISLTIADLLLLRNGSLISAEADDEGNGGSVDISAQFLIAFPQQDSDIIANAFQGNGGRITINNTEGIWGIQERRAIPGNGTNDIDARSEFGVSGTVSINNPDVDPSQVIELPEEVVDSSDQVAQNACQLSAGSQFASTGRGGVPTNPNDAINSDTVRVDLVQPVPSSTGNANIDISSLPLDDEGKPIIPARGWIFTDDGKVLLTAYDPNQIHSQRSSSSQNLCNPR